MTILFHKSNRKIYADFKRKKYNLPIGFLDKPHTCQPGQVKRRPMKGCALSPSPSRVQVCYCSLRTSSRPDLGTIMIIALTTHQVHAFIHLILKKPLGGSYYYYPYFVDKEVELENTTNEE